MAFDSCPDQLIDRFGRKVTYLRLSVTDRCDLRCSYCMAEKMTFLPRKEVLSIEEMLQLAKVFIERGVRKIRLTGGEPLVRRGVLELLRGLSIWLDSGALDEVTLTTNGTLLSQYATELAACGVRRVNVSLDTLDADRYRTVTRLGDIRRVLTGIEAAQAAGLKVKLNAVTSRGPFEKEVHNLITFAHGQGMDLALIEEMPLGDTGFPRDQSALSNSSLIETLRQRWTLTSASNRTGGPARVYEVAETGGQLGFISPMSCNFCALCNRVRLSCTGRLYPCLGDESSVDLRQALKASETAVAEAIQKALLQKPKEHPFDLSRLSVPAVSRHMSVLGG